MEYKTAKRMESLPFSEIRAVMEKATKMQQAGENVIHLEIGRPDFDTPEKIKEAVGVEDAEEVTPLMSGQGMTPLEYGMYLQGQGYATGLERVPYDNFPALLHEGERVLTAAKARSMDAGKTGPSIQITMSGVTIREDADVDRIAERLLAKMRLARLGGAAG